MSVFGEEIINRLNENTSLQLEDNPVRKIILNSVGEWLDNFDEFPFWEQAFLTDAVEGYLDLHGKQYGVPRNLNEVDDDYRQRIILESLGHLTLDYLVDAYDLTIYANVNEFSAEENMLTSDNPYASSEFMVVASSEVQNILDSKFVIGGEVSWLTL